MNSTRGLIKVNANALLSGKVHEHTLTCQCGAPINTKGTRTGRVSSSSLNESNVPKPSKINTRKKK